MSKHKRITKKNLQKTQKQEGLLVKIKRTGVAVNRIGNSCLKHE